MKDFISVKFAAGSEEPLAHLHILLQQFEGLGSYFVGVFRTMHNFNIYDTIIFYFQTQTFEGNALGSKKTTINCVFQIL